MSAVIASARRLAVGHAKNDNLLAAASATGTASEFDPAIKQIEQDAVTAAEAGDLDRALELLSEGITAHPTRGSLYNNRAQVHRMKTDNAAARADLNKAIEVETSWIEAHLDETGSAAFGAHKHVLQQAFTQRSILNQYVDHTRPPTAQQ